MIKTNRYERTQNNAQQKHFKVFYFWVRNVRFICYYNYYTVPSCINAGVNEVKAQITYVCISHDQVLSVIFRYWSNSHKNQ
jgi:hypothetical protein